MHKPQKAKAGQYFLPILIKNSQLSVKKPPMLYKSKSVLPVLFYLIITFQYAKIKKVYYFKEMTMWKEESFI